VAATKTDAIDLNQVRLTVVDCISAFSVEDHLEDMVWRSFFI